MTSQFFKIHSFQSLLCIHPSFILINVSLSISGIPKRLTYNFILYIIYNLRMITLSILQCPGRPWTSPDRCAVANRETMAFKDYKCDRKKAFPICELPYPGKTCISCQLIIIMDSIYIA